MKKRFEFLGIALLLLGLAASSEALTFGRLRGAALIGRPLEVTVQVQFDPGEDASALCFEADVFHADARQDVSRVRVLVEADAPAQTANLRVLSSTPIDEPVVTVYLRTGCGQKTSRRYVLLADFPSEITAPLVPTTARIARPSAPVQDNLASNEPVLRDTAKTAAAAVRATRQSDRRRVAGPRPAVKAAGAPSAAAPAPDKSKSQRIAGQSRLKLDPLELFSDRVASLDSFMTFAPTEDAVRTVQKMQALEADVKALRASATINEVSLRDLNTRLQMAQAQRFPMALVYTLIALVLLCLAAVGYLLYRQRGNRASDNDWWAGSRNRRVLTDGETEPGVALDAELTATAPQEAKARNMSGTHATSVAPQASEHSSEVDVSMVEMSHSYFDQLMDSEGSAHSVHRPPLSPVLGGQGRHALNRNVEAVLDMGHQVEFLVSLGKTEHAIALLKKLIHDSAEPHPSTYLDLLGLLHSLGLKTDFQQTRAEFSRLFNGRVAEFTAFRDEGQSLESYPEALSRIAALWPRPEVHEFIESLIVRDPRHPEGEPFDLAAFRDLLLLYAIIASVTTRPLAKDKESPPTLVPSSRAQVGPQADLPRPAMANPELLDLDLSDSEVDSLQPVSVIAPEVDIAPLTVGVDESVGQHVDPAPKPAAENLLNFDLAELPKLLKPGAPRAS